MSFDLETEPLVESNLVSNERGIATPTVTERSISGIAVPTLLGRHTYITVCPTI
jgi:hypothetical protein